MSTSLDAKEAENSAIPTFVLKRLIEGGFIFFITLAIYILISLITFHLKDPSFHSTSHVAIKNAGGLVGAYLADSLLFLFGYFAYFLPLAIAYLGINLLLARYRFRKLNKFEICLKFTGIIFFILGAISLISIEIPDSRLFFSGGIGGYFLSSALINAFSTIGASMIALAMFLVGLTWFTGISWLGFIKFNFLTIAKFLKKIPKKSVKQDKLITKTILEKSCP